MKKAQLSLYIIIGIFAIAAVSLFFLYMNNNASSENQGNEQAALSSNVDQEYLNTLIHKCVKQTAADAQKKFGIHKVLSPPVMTNYVQEMLPYCVNNFNDFRKNGFEVKSVVPKAKVDITSDAMIIEVTYPVTMVRKGVMLSFEKSSYTFPRTIMDKLEPGKALRMISPDGTVILDIPEGTKATLNGKPVYDIGMKQLDRNFDGLSNAVIAGMMAYDFIPHGVRFSSPVKITYYYQDSDVPPYIEEENMKVGYFSSVSEFWVGLPTEVDPVNNRLTVETDHFSVYSSVVNCGNKDTQPIVQIITPVLVQEACGPCNDGKWTSNIGTAPELFRERQTGDYPNGEDIRGMPLGADKAPLIFRFDDDADAIEWYKGKTLFRSVVEPPLSYPGNEAVYDECGVATCKLKKEIKKFEDKEVYKFAAGDQIIDIDINGEFYKELKNYIYDETEEEGAKYNQIEQEGFFLPLTKCMKVCPNPETSCVTLKNSAVGGTDPKIETDIVSVCKVTNMQYEKVSDLKGRASYELKFPAKGDSCFAEADPKEDDASGSVIFGDVGLFVPVMPDLPYDKEGTGAGDLPSAPKERKPETVTYCPGCSTATGGPLGQETDNAKELKKLQFEIYPECYDSDDCKIIVPTDANGHAIWSAAKKETDGKEYITLKFYVETTNSYFEKKAADACLMANARIQFLGTPPKGSYNLLCDSKSEGITDVIEGKYCMKCTKKWKYESPTYKWENIGDGSLTKCIGTPAERICPASLIGRKYTLNVGGTPTCFRCMPPSNALKGGLPYGELVEDADCSMCADTPGQVAEE